MPRRKLDLTERQIRAIIRAAKKEKVAIEIGLGNAVVRILANSAVPEDLATLIEREANDARADYEHRDLVTPRQEIPEWVHSGVRKVLAEGALWEYSEFKSHVQGKPLNKREREALKILSTFGVGRELAWKDLSIGLNTQDRLEARGFIDVIPHPKFADRIGSVALTIAGLAAAETQV